MATVGYHPNIVNILDYNLDGYELLQDKVYEISYTVLEYCPKGTLYEHIKKSEKLDINVAKFYLKQLVHAVKHLHDLNIVHCDIKPGNIFLDKIFNLKLADLGCALQLNHCTDGVTRCFGTKTYMAPEVFRASDKNPYSPFKADVYSIGATLYFMLTGKTPNPAETSQSTHHDSNVTPSPTFAEITRLEVDDSLAVDLICRTTHKDPNKRYTIDDMLSHPWLNEDMDPELGLYVFEYMTATGHGDK